MELATDPRTVTGNLARPWHPPVGPPPTYWPAARVVETPGVASGADQAELDTAADELAVARAALAEIPSSDDPWPDLMARHAIFLARRRLRVIEELLTLSAEIGLRHP
ncbi:MAG: hypothetical protein ABI661_06415 [Gammaproteobacteria bacterium]